jgi:hypothetical protein
LYLVILTRGKQEKGNQKKPEPFAPNNKKCYTFVFQIFLE